MLADFMFQLRVVGVKGHKYFCHSYLCPIELRAEAFQVALPWMPPEASVGPLVTYVTAASYLCHSTTVIHFWGIVFLSLSLPLFIRGEVGCFSTFSFCRTGAVASDFFRSDFFPPFRPLLFMI